MYSHIGILVCDDSPDDCDLLGHAFARAGINAQFRSVTSGPGAMDYLLGRGPYTARLTPALIFLDIKMPGADGFEVLAWIRAHPTLRALPVIMLSGSDLQADVDRAFYLGCNAYAAKPHGLESMLSLVKSVQSFWLDQSKYPSCCGKYTAPSSAAPAATSPPKICPDP